MHACSPSCLIENGSPAQQARAQVLGTLLIPCAVVLMCLAIWTIR